MRYETLRVEREGHVARVVINRPEKLNAITLQFIEEFPAAFDELGTDPEVRVIIMKGAGSAFSVGFDHSVTMESCGFVDALSEILHSRRWLKGLFRIWDCPKVVIAQLHGWAIGWGGLPLLFSDLRYGSDEFKVFYAAGVTGAHLPEIWSWFIGPTAAAEFAFRPNHRFTADELWARGLLNAVFPLNDLEREVESVAAEIATTDSSFTHVQKLSLHRRLELQGFREQILASKELDAVLHWSTIGQANMDRLQGEFAGDRRRVAEAQAEPGYWESLRGQPGT